MTNSEQDKLSARKFIVSERLNGLGLSVMNHGATFHQSADRIYYQVIEIKALKVIERALEAERERSRKLLEALKVICKPGQSGDDFKIARARFEVARQAIAEFEKSK